MIQEVFFAKNAWFRSLRKRELFDPETLESSLWAEVGTNKLDFQGYSNSLIHSERAGAFALLCPKKAEWGGKSGHLKARFLMKMRASWAIPKGMDSVTENIPLFRKGA